MGSPNSLTPVAKPGYFEDATIKAGFSAIKIIPGRANCTQGYQIVTAGTLC